MGMAYSMRQASVSLRGLTASVLRMAAETTNAAAAMVPSQFRRDTAADVARLALEQFTTGLTLGAFSRDTAADRAALAAQIAATGLTQRAFAAAPGDPRLTESTLRPGDPRLTMFSRR